MTYTSKQHYFYTKTYCYKFYVTVVILGVAISLSLIILLMLLVVLYCCEKYRHNKRFRRLLSMLGAPQVESDTFDELDFGKESWKKKTSKL